MKWGGWSCHLGAPRVWYLSTVMQWLMAQLDTEPMSPSPTTPVPPAISPSHLQVHGELPSLFPLSLLPGVDLDLYVTSWEMPVVRKPQCPPGGHLHSRGSPHFAMGSMMDPGTRRVTHSSQHCLVSFTWCSGVRGLPLVGSQEEGLSYKTGDSWPPGLGRGGGHRSLDLLTVKSSCSLVSYCLLGKKGTSSTTSP